MENPATNTTTPGDPPYLWVAEPRQRGTVGILWFCFTTLIICIWSTMHFDIPTRRYSAIRRFVLQLPWMILAFLAPEVLLFLAINERITAGILLEKVLVFDRSLAKPGRLAQMYNWINERVMSKGVSAQCQAPLIYKLTVTEQTRGDRIGKTSPPQFGIVHAFYAIMGGFAFHGSFNDHSPTADESLLETATNARHTVEVPRFDTLIYIMKHFPRIITSIPEEAILDRAESSSMSKAVLIVQVGWFCISGASRLFQGLPLSLLEVSTTSRVFCTLITYFVWLSKPFNVAAPTILEGKEAQEVYALLKCSEFEYNEALQVAKERATTDSSAPTGPQQSAKIVMAAKALRPLLSEPEGPPPQPGFKTPKKILFPGNFGNKSSSAEKAKSMAIYAALSPIVYGLIHSLAWSGQFPTALERSLWRASSFIVTCSGLVGVFLLWSSVWLDGVLKSKYGLDDIAVIFVCVIPVVHMLASGFLIVESFRQLYFLDPAAYQLPSWPN